MRRGNNVYGEVLEHENRNTQGETGKVRSMVAWREAHPKMRSKTARDRMRTVVCMVVVTVAARFSAKWHVDGPEPRNSCSNCCRIALFHLCMHTYEWHGTPKVLT